MTLGLALLPTVITRCYWVSCVFQRRIILLWNTTRPFWVVALVWVTEDEDTCGFAEKQWDQIWSLSLRENSPGVKPGVTLQPCCAHITRSSIPGTQMQNGRRMFFVLLSVWSVSGTSCALSTVALAKFGDGAPNLLALTRATSYSASHHSSHDVILPFVCYCCTLHFVMFYLIELIRVAHQTIPYKFSNDGNRQIKL